MKWEFEENVVLHINEDKAISFHLPLYAILATVISRQLKPPLAQELIVWLVIRVDQTCRTRVHYQKKTYFSTKMYVVGTQKTRL